MILLQSTYRNDVGELLANKEHVTDTAGAEAFLSFILNISYCFAFLAIAMTCYMVFRRIRMNNNKIVESKLKEKYQDFLSNFLTLPIDDSFIGISKSDQFPTRLDPKDITDSHRRKILANEIFNFKKQLSGQHATQLSNYFFGLGLQKEVIDLINSYSWTDQVRGMQLTNEFQIVEGLTHINKYINHKNSEIAIHTLVTRLSFDKSIVVLNEIERKLTAWEWHKIVHEIEKLKISNVDFKTLIAAKKQDYKLIQIAEQRLNPSPARVQIPTL